MPRYEAQFINAQDRAIDLYLTDDVDSFADALREIADQSDIPAKTVGIDIRLAEPDEAEAA